MGPLNDESGRVQALRELRTRSSGSLLVRTDFSDDQAWLDIHSHAAASVLVTGGDEFQADVHIVDDPQFEGLEAAELAAAGADWSLGHVAFLVDGPALMRPYPVVAVELQTGQTVRVLLNSLWVIENNLAGGKPLSQYAESAVDGIYHWPAGGISLAPDPSTPGQSIDGYRDPRRFPEDDAKRARKARHRHVAQLAEEVSRRRLDGARVVEGFVEWLSSQGWTVRTEVNFVDVVAEKDGRTLYAEAKGTTTAPGLDVNTAIGQLVTRMPTGVDEHASFALVVRDEPGSVKAAVQAPQRVLDLLRISLYAVDEDGEVRQLAGRG